MHTYQAPARSSLHLMRATGAVPRPGPWRLLPLMAWGGLGAACKPLLTMQAPAQDSRRSVARTVPTRSSHITAYSAQDQAPAAGSRKPLYVDALNIAGFFFTEPSHWGVSVARTLVRQFVEAAARSGYVLTVFIDAAILSDEAQGKWARRREEEVALGKRNVPAKMSVMLEEMFRWGAHA